MFTFGIEHEVAFLNSRNQFADYCYPTSYRDFSEIIAQLPLYPNDYPRLIIGDAGIRVKRWYLEGLERFDDEGHMLYCLSKGIEIRTTPHLTIQGAINELTESFTLLHEMALKAGFTPVLTSFNPYRTRFIANPPFNSYEEGLLSLSPEDSSALLAMLTYGPDLSFSIQGWSNQALIDLGRKLTYYSPFLIPFTYSSPFYAGHAWNGLSVRTFLRTGLRPAALVFLDSNAEMVSSTPSLTKRARISAEIGRIEFKACDACDDFRIYACLFALFKGLALDTTLPGRATVPDANLHKRSARYGFTDLQIAATMRQILEAARHALGEDEDRHLLAELENRLENYQPPAYKLTHDYNETRSIESALLQSYVSYRG